MAKATVATTEDRRSTRRRGVPATEIAEICEKLTQALSQMESLRAKMREKKFSVIEVDGASMFDRAWELLDKYVEKAESGLKAAIREQSRNR